MDYEKTFERKRFDDETISLIKEIVGKSGGAPDSFEGELIMQMVQTCLKLITDEHTTAQIKLMNRALKEIRYAYRIFNQFKELKCISIFGSARTPEVHPDYIAAKSFSAALAEKNWMCITGAAKGIMKAGHEGMKSESRIGLSIRLAFESETPMMEGDPKLINFHYFFTRKLMFMNHSFAIAVFPGGVGTMDELYEALTLMQTGKSNLVPLVLLEGSGGHYWRDWWDYFEKNLVKNGWVCPEDRYLFYMPETISDAVNHVEHFYFRYHSMRYVKDQLVIRIQTPLEIEQVRFLNERFRKLVKEGEIVQREALEVENEYMDLPRIVFKHTRKDMGILRQMIDQINDFE